MIIHVTCVLRQEEEGGEQDKEKNNDVKRGTFQGILVFAG
jgi:hypothetical protein